MYERYFGLNEKPFAITPDADLLYFSEKHKSALIMLEYGVFEQSGVTVISGEVGTGKTTLVRHLLGTIPYDRLTVGLVSNVHPSLGSLLQWVSIALHLGDHVDNVSAFRRLQDFLVEEYAEGRRVVLIIDEAQNMDMACLEELRMLMNINADKNHLLQVVLVGQSSLLEMLKDPTMDQLAQRVTAEYHLSPLNLEETKEYVACRLAGAGAKTSALFDHLACQTIQYFSGGVPRLINTLCDHALVLAYGQEKAFVDFEVALAAVEQKKIGGVLRARENFLEGALIRDEVLANKNIDLETYLT